MIGTENQRRWWFATHPEFSHKGERTRKPHKESSGISPEDVDRFVDEALKYQKNPVIIEMLKATKRWFGTAGETPESYAELGLAYLGAKTEETAETSSPEKPAGASQPPENEKDRKENPTFLEELAAGFNRVYDNWQFQIGLGNRHSRELARNLVLAEKPRPTDHAAHHIVPWDDGRFLEAVKARKLLKALDIKIDEAVNGVWLPYKANISGATYHPSVHTGVYYREVVRLLKTAKTRDEGVKILESIGRELSKGTFPR